MLDNFKEIYDQEIKKCDYDGLAKTVLSSREMRMFVYEVCKRCLLSQLDSK